MSGRTDPAAGARLDAGAPCVQAPRRVIGGPRVENTDYAAFLRRAIRAHGRRVAGGDLEGLAELVELRAELDRALEEAVAGLRAKPHSHSWQAIADVLGVTRQAAMSRWPNAGGARRAGGQPSNLR